MIYPIDIVNLKTDITEIIGQKIVLKGTLGKNKFFEKEAKIEKTYPNIFIVKYENEEGNHTYTYKDLLTHSVEVSVYNGEEYNPLLPPIVEQKKIKKI